MRAKKAKAVERMCIGCGQRKPKSALCRLVLTKDGQPVLDRGQSGVGRGAYLCGPLCLKAAVKRRAFGRAFRGKASGGREGGMELAALGESLRAANSSPS